MSTKWAFVVLYMQAKRLPYMGASFYVTRMDVCTHSNYFWNAAFQSQLPRDMGYRHSVPG